MKHLKTVVCSIAATLALTGCDLVENEKKVEVEKEVNVLVEDNGIKNSPKALNWFAEGRAEVASAQEVAAAINNTKGAAKNVILFIGDGMGVSTVTAARILEGQTLGKEGEDHQLSFEKFPFSGFVKTYNTNQQTPDSAGTVTAMMSGVKTKAGVLGVSSSVTRLDCESSQGIELRTALELAEIAGKATGVISTARITHATPAGAYSKSADRNWEDISDMGDQADKGCLDIADQLINFESLLENAVNAGEDHENIDGLEIVMGGGRRHFLPKDSAFNVELPAESGAEGDRTDGRDLTAEWKAQYPEGAVVHTQAEFDALTGNESKVLGLFNESHMLYEADRGNDIGGEPSLSEMTSKAVDYLKKDEDGFFLMVEAGRIDHGHHAGTAYNALTDTVEFAKAVQDTIAKVDLNETLIIVTADHSHVFTIAGYPTRGNPILGKVVENNSDGTAKTEPVLATDDLPYTTVGYTNGLGFADLGAETNGDARYGLEGATGRQDISAVDTEAPGYHQEALVPLSAETHAGEDVGVYAVGPGAHLLTGTNEQTLVFHVMNYAADLLDLATAEL